MEQYEKRLQLITYCDWCHKEIRPTYSSITLKDGHILNLCSEPIPKDGLVCIDKYHKLKALERKKPVNE